MRSLRSCIALAICLTTASWLVAQQKGRDHDNDRAPLPESAVKVGQMAPDFTLKDQTGNQVSLHDFRGKQNVALAFYVFAFSPT
jgi:cytochrome oxidase Cu insertion factor (SCO1/SenC/PrrC family)